MRKKIFLTYLLSIVILMIAVNMATVNASISTHNWIGPTYTGSDSLLGTTVTAYRTGSTAKLVVNVYSNYYVGYPYYGYRPVNISAVKVCPDWNINYTSTEATWDSPIVIQPYQYHLFTITFTVPNTTIASNLIAHSYRIYVEHVNSTGGARKIVDTWTYSGSGLAVYSEEQADTMQIVQKYSGISMPSFTYPEAQVLWTKASLEAAIGARSYRTGNFTDAKIHYTAMDDLIQQALQTESTNGSALADSEAYSNTKNADAATSTANALMVQSYGYILVGLGLTLFGIGAIIYGIRRQS